MKDIKPLKRHIALQPLSRQHHHGLLLSWKIGQGLKLKINKNRIKRYIDWFWKNHLTHHFDFEEKYIFPILGKSNKLVERALNEHRRLEKLFMSKTATTDVISSIQDELIAHIRFEERVLFTEIQKEATESEMSLIVSSHEQLSDADEWEDTFWEKSS